MRINDIFYSLQGEGVNTGRAAVFVRFAGCNRQCSYCDTDFRRYREMTIGQIIDEVTTADHGSRRVILTGGEPAMQVNDKLIDAFHSRGYVIAIETNGSLPLPDGLDWITVSPKGDTAVKHCNELKCVFTDDKDANDHGIKADFYCLQPCDTGDKERNARITKACVEYIKRHPRWRLSLQTHKLAGFK